MYLHVSGRHLAITEILYHSNDKKALERAAGAELRRMEMNRRNAVVSMIERIARALCDRGYGDP